MRTAGSNLGSSHGDRHTGALGCLIATEFTQEADKAVAQARGGGRVEGAIRRGWWGVFQILCAEQ